MKKNGFTLVELLAVIVILAVILVIAIPQITKVIKQTRVNAMQSTAKLIVTKAEEKEVENEALEITETMTCSDLVKLDDNYNASGCRVEKNAQDKWEVSISGAAGKKFEGITCTGTKDNMTCTDGEESDENQPCNAEYCYHYGYSIYEVTYQTTDSCVSIAEMGLYYESENPQADAQAFCDGTGKHRGYTLSEHIDMGHGPKYESYGILTAIEGENYDSNIKTDWRNIKDSNNQQIPIFLKFKNDLSEIYTCTLYSSTGSFATEPTCFSANVYKNKAEANSEWNTMKALFDPNDENICGNSSCHIANQWNCNTGNNYTSCFFSDNPVEGIPGVGCEVYDDGTGACFDYFDL